jgi:hypothetical protein
MQTFAEVPLTLTQQFGDQQNIGGRTVAWWKRSERTYNRAETKAKTNVSSFIPVISSWAVAVRAINAAVGCWICCWVKKKSPHS